MTGERRQGCDCYYDYAVFIGRFQPFHRGHLHVFTEALKRAQTLVVLVGSADTSRTLRNPFTFAEREAVMQAALPDAMRNRLVICPLHDIVGDDQAWVASVSRAVSDAVQHSLSSQLPRSPLPHRPLPRRGGQLATRMATTGTAVGTATEATPSVALVGHDKDDTTYYLKLFPDWAYIEVDNLDGINATAVRERYFAGDLPTAFGRDMRDTLSPTTIAWLRRFSHCGDFTVLARAYQAKHKGENHDDKHHDND